MSVSVVVPIVMSAFVVATCQKSPDETEAALPDSFLLESNKTTVYLLHRCESYTENLTRENIHLKERVQMLEKQLESLETLKNFKYEKQELKKKKKVRKDEKVEDEDELEEESANGSHPWTPFREKRGAGCDGGTLAAWACAPQCVFKLKGLCGLSLKSICHC